MFGYECCVHAEFFADIFSPIQPGDIVMSIYLLNTSLVLYLTAQELRGGLTDERRRFENRMRSGE